MCWYVLFKCTLLGSTDSTNDTSLLTKHRSYRLLLLFSHTQVCRSPKWHARRAAIEFAQNMIFNNLFNARPYAKQLHELVLKCLFDEHFEVRNAALITLSGFYLCGYIQITLEDLVGQYCFFPLLMKQVFTYLL